MKVAFLDRDGTIIKDYPNREWANIKTPQFLEGSIDALQHIKNKGFEIIIITNQYLIGEGIITLEDYKSFNDLFLKALNQNGTSVLDVFYCPHAKNENCDCMKPSSGLINQALYKYPNVNLKESFYVGDSVCDMKLASNFNLKFYGINMFCKNTINSLNEIKKFL